LVFENGIALDSSEAQFFDEFALQILDNEVDRTDGKGLLFGGSEIFRLSNVGLKESSN
jgi:hypothetical protein